MRRQKCDRNVPCGRCVKRGNPEKCSTSWGPDGYDPKVHRVYPRTETKLPQDDQASLQSPTSITASSPYKQHAGRTPASASAGSGPTPDQSTVMTPATAPYVRHEQPPQTSSSTIDFLSWGKTSLSDYSSRVQSISVIDDPRAASGLFDPVNSTDEAGMSSCFGGTAPAQISFLQLLMPSKRQVFQLAEYHIEQLLWYHACFHGPTFHAELTAAGAGPQGLQVKNMDLRWAALLFSVMAASMVSVNDSIALSWGFQKEERGKLTRQWFKSCLTCLNLADFMRCHHIYSVQAITILTQSAHFLGYSNTQTGLLGAALKVSQGLGLQRLGLEEDETNFASRTGRLIVPAQRQKIVQREIGRRLWAQQCLQDWFQIPFSEMYSINRLHFSTLKPSNMDDSTLQICSDEVPTGVAFSNFLLEIARLMPQMHDAVLSANTLYTKYEHVLEWDAKMRQLVTEGCPKFLNALEPLEPYWPLWVPWARRSTSLCYYHKIIMIHRPFLGRSFTEPTFAYSRRACLAASKAVLKDAKQAYDDEGPSLWIDQAFMVASGITLALDTFHRREGEPELEEHKRLVETTINMLGKYDDSMIGLRGCRLLASLLAEQAKLCTSNQMENFRKHALESGEQGAEKRQKFDVSKFVEQFVGTSTLTGLKVSGQPPTPAPPAPNGAPSTDDINGGVEALDENAYSYEQFEQLFPPQAGISNNFLFEDLLNFDV